MGNLPGMLFKIGSMLIFFNHSNWVARDFRTGDFRTRRDQDSGDFRTEERSGQGDIWTRRHQDKERSGLGEIRTGQYQDKETSGHEILGQV